MVVAGAGQSSLFYNSPKLNLSLSLSGTDQSTETRRRTATPVMKSVKTALVLITLMLVGIIKEEIKIVFIIIRCQDFLVEFKVGEFCTRVRFGIVSL